MLLKLLPIFLVLRRRRWNMNSQFELIKALKAHQDSQSPSVLEKNVAKNYVKKRLLDVKEAAEYLGISENALYKKVWKRQVPFAIKIGRTLRFDKVRMDEWIESNLLKVKKS